MIDAVESAEAVAPGHVDFGEHRSRVDERLTALRSSFEDL